MSSKDIPSETPSPSRSINRNQQPLSSGKDGTDNNNNFYFSPTAGVPAGTALAAQGGLGAAVPAASPSTAQPVVVSTLGRKLRPGNLAPTSERPSGVGGGGISRQQTEIIGQAVGGGTQQQQQQPTTTSASAFGFGEKGSPLGSPRWPFSGSRQITEASLHDITSLNSSTVGGNVNNNNHSNNLTWNDFFLKGAAFNEEDAHQYTQLFDQQEMPPFDWKVLLYLDNEFLLSAGIDKAGHRARIIGAAKLAVQQIYGGSPGGVGVSTPVPPDQQQQQHSNNNIGAMSTSTRSTNFYPYGGGAGGAGAASFRPSPGKQQQQGPNSNAFLMSRQSTEDISGLMALRAQAQGQRTGTSHHHINTASAVGVHHSDASSRLQPPGAVNHNNSSLHSSLYGGGGAGSRPRASSTNCIPPHSSTSHSELMSMENNPGDGDNPLQLHSNNQRSPVSKHDGNISETTASSQSRAAAEHKDYNHHQQQQKGTETKAAASTTTSNKQEVSAKNNNKKNGAFSSSDEDEEEEEVIRRQGKVQQQHEHRHSRTDHHHHHGQHTHYQETNTSHSNSNNNKGETSKITEKEEEEDKKGENRKDSHAGRGVPATKNTGGIEEQKRDGGGGGGREREEGGTRRAPHTTTTAASDSRHHSSSSSSPHQHQHHHGHSLYRPSTPPSHSGGTLQGTANNTTTTTTTTGTPVMDGQKHSFHLSRLRVYHEEDEEVPVQAIPNRRPQEEKGRGGGGGNSSPMLMASSSSRMLLDEPLLPKAAAAAASPPASSVILMSKAGGGVGSINNNDDVVVGSAPYGGSLRRHRASCLDGDDVNESLAVFPTTNINNNSNPNNPNTMAAAGGGGGILSGDSSKSSAMGGGGGPTTTTGLMRPTNPSMPLLDPNRLTVQEFVSEEVDGSSFRWVDLAGRDVGRVQYRDEIKRICTEYAFAPSLLADIDLTLALPQVITSPEEPFQYLLILRVATEYTDVEEDSLHLLTQRWMIAINLKNNVIVTIHKADNSAIARTRVFWDQHYSSSLTMGEFVTQLIDDSLEAYIDAVQESEFLLDHYEGVMLEHSAGDSSGGVAARSLLPFLGKKYAAMRHLSSRRMNQLLYHLHRRCSVYARMLHLTQEAIESAYTSLNLCSPDYAEQMARACGELALKAESLHDNCQNLLNLHLSLLSFRTNELMGILTTFSAFFIPLTFIAGVYGMNFVNMPELKWENGYFYCLALMAAVCILIAVLFRSKGLL